MIRRISCIKNTFNIDASNEVRRNANVVHCPNGNKNKADVTYRPGNVVIFGSHCNQMKKEILSEIFSFDSVSKNNIYNAEISVTIMSALPKMEFFIDDILRSIVY